VGDEFAQSLRAHLVTQTTESWMFWYGLLETFVKEHEHCRVRVSHKTNEGYRLGHWAATQRRNKETMDPMRRQRLEALPGWSWDFFLDLWEEGFSHLKAFSDREGHCRVVRTDETNEGYQLGEWVADQRSAKNTMGPMRRQRLEALPGWSWDVFSNQWEKGFYQLKQFSDREGHCRMRYGYKTDDGYPLGHWVAVQKRTKDSLTPDRRQRLEALPSWSWDVLLGQWEKGFYQLKQFSDREGHCRVRDGYKTDDGYPLGRWVAAQRIRKDSLPLDRQQRLEALPGWSWDAVSDRWDDGFSHLKKFLERKGHCQVPHGYKSESGYSLGTWVGRQRRQKDTMDPMRRQRLEALPGWSWGVYSDQWEQGFSYLKQFSEREGHCQVPTTFKTDDDYPLGQWVAVQRRTKNPPAPDRRQRLEALPGWVWKVEK
jgi:hypothetical protein